MPKATEVLIKDTRTHGAYTLALIKELAPYGSVGHEAINRIYLSSSWLKLMLKLTLTLV